jgi:hypothetical protein
MISIEPEREAWTSSIVRFFEPVAALTSFDGAIAARRRREMERGLIGDGERIAGWWIGGRGRGCWLVNGRWGEDCWLVGRREREGLLVGEWEMGRGLLVGG